MNLARHIPLPAAWEECQQRGWDWFDILLVTGDAYVDHPSFGVALIGRYLEAHGYRVAVLSQPRYDTATDFLQFPTPRLFCGITGGNLDSIVANYTGNGKIREKDAYSPGGNPWRSPEKNKNNRYRPDRASLIYSNLARSSFKETPIVLGGIEASLRRFVHYDYKQEKLRASFLTDAKADLLVYGMGERAVVATAQRCEKQLPLTGIAGSCERLTDQELYDRFPQFAGASVDEFLVLPSHAEILHDPDLFLKAEVAIDKQAREQSRRIILQRQQTHWLVQHPPAPLLSETELDALYSLPFSRMSHPSTPDVPALRMIEDSVTIVRGCSGNCSFCAITRHQGAIVQSRSQASIIDECRTIAALPGFKGTITDLGGPTANLYGTSCTQATCTRHDCLFPKICRNLHIDTTAFVDLLKAVSTLDNIKHVFVSSGLRMELLLQTPELLRMLLADHTPGAMKIAPEHSSEEVLRLMHKEDHELLKRFVRICRDMGNKMGREIHFVPYVISAHPGCTERHAGELAEDMAKLGLTISKFQDFTPTPGTLSTAMYVSGRDRTTEKPIFVARNVSQRMRQRRIVEERFHGRPAPGTLSSPLRKKKQH
jgi:uncharacterized radical SAM protein YgiQ